MNMSKNQIDPLRTTQDTRNVLKILIILSNNADPLTFSMCTVFGPFHRQCKKRNWILFTNPKIYFDIILLNPLGEKMRQQNNA